MNVEIGQVWKDIAGGKSRIVEIALASWGIVYIGEPVGDPNRLLHYARSDLVELVSEAALTDNDVEAEVLENLLNDEGDTYAVFSLSKTYDSESEARAAAMKYAQTGGVWHVAKVVGSAIPREPEWRGAV